MGRLNSTQRTQILSDAIHAGVVVTVVLAASMLAVLNASIPPDVIGAVFGGAIGYAAGRAGNVRPAPEDDRIVPVPSAIAGGRRATDPPDSTPDAPHATA